MKSTKWYDMFALFCCISCPKNQNSITYFHVFGRPVHATTPGRSKLLDLLAFPPQQLKQPVTSSRNHRHPWWNAATVCGLQHLSPNWTGWKKKCHEWIGPSAHLTFQDTWMGPLICRHFKANTEERGGFMKEGVLREESPNDWWVMMNAHFFPDLLAKKHIQKRKQFQNNKSSIRKTQNKKTLITISKVEGQSFEVRECSIHNVGPQGTITALNLQPTRFRISREQRLAGKHCTITQLDLSQLVCYQASPLLILPNVAHFKGQVF